MFAVFLHSGVLMTGPVRATEVSSIAAHPKLSGIPLAIVTEAGGRLYAHVGDRVYSRSIDNPEVPWDLLALADVVQLQRNQVGDVFVFCRGNATTHIVYQLEEGEPEEIFRGEVVDPKSSYVDAVGRVWSMTEESLTILQNEKPPRVIKSPKDKFRVQLRKPCEWKPGHIVLFHRTTMIVADRTTIRSVLPPRFATDGTGTGPIRLGTDFLLSGGRNNIGRGSYLMRTEDPTVAARKVPLGWDWLKPIATSPNGDALVSAQTDRNPRFTLFWFAADGKSQVRLEGADDVLRAGISDEVMFDTRGNGYARLNDGTLGVFEATKASVVTEAKGLPFLDLRHVAMVDDQCLLVSESGEVAVWNTKIALQGEPAEEFDRRRIWKLSGPVCVDSTGMLWAFLFDFPGKVSRFDGHSWTHTKIEMLTRKPTTMTADDLGAIQIGYVSHPAGSTHIIDGKIRSWPNAPVRAWQESITSGATRFFNGSAQRTRHWTDGSGWGWFYNGRYLWDGSVKVDYGGGQGHDRWWVDSNRRWFRAGGKQVSEYRTGRWRNAASLPAELFVTTRGLTSERSSDCERMLRVTSDFVAHGVRPVRSEVNRTRKSSSLRVFDQVPLQDGDFFLASAEQGGWLGKHRYLQGVFLPTDSSSTYYNTAFGRVSVDRSSTWLSVPVPTPLKISGNAKVSDGSWTINYRVKSPKTSTQVRALVVLDGIAEPMLVDSGVIELPPRVRGSIVEIWAVDEHGHASKRPMRLRLDEPEKKQAIRPQWKVFSKNIVVDGVAHQLADQVASGRNQFVFAIARADARQRKTGRRTRKMFVLVCFDERQDRWHTIPTGDVSIGRLLASPQGDIFATEASQLRERETTIFRVTTRGIYPVNDFYDVGHMSHPGSRTGWDDQGRFWNLGKRWLGCFNGKDWKEWEVSTGFQGKLVAGDGGRALITVDGKFWFADDNGIGDAFELPEGWQNGSFGYPLSGPRVVIRCIQSLGRNRSRQGWGIFNTETGELDVESIFASTAIRSDGHGRVYAWNRSTGTLKQIDGTEAEARSVPYIDLPHDSWNTWNPTGLDFLGTPNGGFLYVRDVNSIFVYSEKQGVAQYGWRQGIQASRTAMMQQAADGRIWLVREREIAIYDPAGAVTDDPTRFVNWKELEVVGNPCRGFNGAVWMWKPDRSGVVCYDGANEKTWTIENVDATSIPNVMVTTDTGDAMVCEQRSYGQVWLLKSDGKLSKVDDAQSGVLALVDAGAKRFHASGPLPVVMKTGHVYFDGQIWNGTQWTPSKQGRPFLDTLDQLAINSGGDHGPRIHLFEGGQLRDVPTAARYLIDEYGLRSYDVKLLEAKPNHYPIVGFKDRRYTLAAAETIDPTPLLGQPMTAVASEEGGHLISMKYSGVYRLHANGLEQIDPALLPFGRQRATPHQLASGLWCWVLKEKVFESPATFVPRPQRETPP